MSQAAQRFIGYTKASPGGSCRRRRLMRVSCGAPRCRQKVIGNFIVDFYCDKVKLAIELDGAQHYEEDAQAYDAERTAYLNGLGITVVRFSNFEIWTNFDGVCASVEAIIGAL